MGLKLGLHKCLSLIFFSDDVFLKMKTLVNRLEEENQKQKETITFLQKRLKSLSSPAKIAKKIAFAGQETPLSVVSVDQLTSKQKIDKRKIWTEEEVVNFLMLKTVSPQAYELIRQNQVPQMDDRLLQ